MSCIDNTLSELDLISTWTYISNLKLNHSKSKEMVVKRLRSKPIALRPPMPGIERIHEIVILDVTISSRLLRSVDRCDLLVPWSRTSLTQNRTFAVVGPALCNDTTPALQSVMLQGISPASLFSLKTFLFTCLSR